MIKNNNVIVCDIQPMYDFFIQFDLNKFCKNFLNKRNKIIYYYNKIDQISNKINNENDIIKWLLDHGLLEDKINDINFINKGYGYLRDWMDHGVSDEHILITLKFLKENNLKNSNDIKNILELLPYVPYGNISIPNFTLPDINIFKNATLIGGVKQLCLRELQLLFNIYDIKYKLNKRYIY